MKTIVKTVCLLLLLGALGVPASFRGDSGAAAAALNSAVVPPSGDLPIRFDHIATEQGLSNLNHVAQHIHQSYPHDSRQAYEK